MILCTNHSFGQVIKQLSAAKYERIQNYRHNDLEKLGRLFLVKKNKKYGIIDANGKELLPPIYDQINEASNNRIAVQKNRKWGFMNYQFKLVIPFQYDLCISKKFLDKHPNRCVIANRCMEGVIDSMGNQIIPNKYSYLELLDNKTYISSLYRTGVFGVMNEDESLVIDYVYDNIEFDSENTLKVRKNEKFGWIDFSGKTIIPIEYDFVWKFSEGLACVKIGEKWGFIDRNNKLVIPPKLSSPNAFHNNKCLFRVNNTLYQMDTKGNTQSIPRVSHYSFSDIPGINDIMTAVVNNKTGYQRKDNSWLIKPQYAFGRDFSEGRATIYKNGKWSQIDTMNNVIMPWYDNELGDYADGLISIFKNGKFGYMDTLGNIKIPIVYEHAKRFNEGFALVKKNGKWGYISTKNEVIIDFQYDSGNSFQGGFVTVIKNGKQLILNENGKIIFDKPYRSLMRTKNFMGIGTTENTLLVSNKSLQKQSVDQIMGLTDEYYAVKKNNLWYLGR